MNQDQGNKKPEGVPSLPAPVSVSFSPDSIELQQAASSPVYGRVTELLDDALDCDDAAELDHLAAVVHDRARAIGQVAAKLYSAAQILATDAQQLENVAEQAAQKAAQKLEECDENA